MKQTNQERRSPEQLLLPRPRTQQEKEETNAEIERGNGKHEDELVVRVHKEEEEDDDEEGIEEQEEEEGEEGGRLLIAALFLPVTLRATPTTVALSVHSEEETTKTETIPSADAIGSDGGLVVEESNAAAQHLALEDFGSVVLISREFDFIPAAYGNVGMYNAVRTLDDRMTICKFGSMDIAVAEPLQDIVNERMSKEQNCIPIYIPAKVFQSHYQHFCKHTLWPLMHYILPDVESESYYGRDEKYLKDYIAVNQQFADKLIESYEPGDIIWIQDYHLLLVPSMIRKQLPDAKIGFFLHVPFPSYEIFRCLFARKIILEGMLGANLIGFQTYAFARHFIQTCLRVLGCETTYCSVSYKGKDVSVQIFPMGINVDELSRKIKEPQVSLEIESFLEKYKGKKILIGRDKLDYIKGIPHKLIAFENFLSRYSEWVGKVILVQVTTISTSSKALETEIFDIVNRINRKFGSLEYSPVHYLHQNIPFLQYIALMTIADVCLITSLRDGMNLTSHEYIVCQHENHNPLILSEFTGTYGSLSGAIRVNPWDYPAVADAIYEALTMSPIEKEKNHLENFRVVSIHSAQNWAQAFVKQLNKVVAQHRIYSHLPRANITELSNVFHQITNRRLLILELASLMPRDCTDIPENVIQLIERLCSNLKNIVYIVSDKQKHELERWFGHIANLGLSAETGCFVRDGDSSYEWVCLLNDVDISWRNGVREIFEYYTERTPGSFIEEKEICITLHFRQTDSVYGAWQAHQCTNHIATTYGKNYPIQIRQDLKFLEVRPLNANKVSILKRLIASRLVLKSEIDSSDSDDFVLYIGSTKSDEEVFEYLKSHSVNMSLQPNLSKKDVAIFRKSSISSSSSSGTSLSSPPLSHGEIDVSSSPGLIRTNSNLFHTSVYFQWITCCVGNQHSEAKQYINTPKDVLRLLKKLGNEQDSTFGGMGSPDPEHQGYFPLSNDDELEDDLARR